MYKCFRRYKFTRFKFFIESFNSPGNYFNKDGFQMVSNLFSTNDVEGNKLIKLSMMERFFKIVKDYSIFLESIGKRKKKRLY